MSTETNQTDATAPEPGTSHADELLAALAERLGAEFSASKVFGDPIEREGVTVVPVAVARFGFGGGSGTDPKAADAETAPKTTKEGTGGGGGGMVAASGYIEIKDGKTRFVPIVHPARMLALVAATVVAGLLIARPAARHRREFRPPWR